MKITYVCAQTKSQVTTDGALPSGWIIPSQDLSSDIDKPVPKRGTIIAFSSKAACEEYSRSRLENRLNSVDF